MAFDDVSINPLERTPVYFNEKIEIDPPHIRATVYFSRLFRQHHRQ